MEIQDLNNISKTGLFRLGVKILCETIYTRGRNFIYIPRRYDEIPEYEDWKKEVTPIPYQVGKHSLQAWVDSDPIQPPDRVWLMFGGNASLALDWLPITTIAPPSSDAFVLFEYPGYGDNQGKASRPMIRRCIDELIVTLLDRFDMNPTEINTRFRVMGHSLGAAIALDTAARYQIREGVLIAPFTTVRAIGATMFWKPLTYLAADPYDNLDSLTKLPADSKFQIHHGQLDNVIPVEMGKALNEAFPKKTRLNIEPEADHNDIIVMLAKQLATTLTKESVFR